MAMIQYKPVVPPGKNVFDLSTPQNTPADLKGPIEEPGREQPQTPRELGYYFPAEFAQHRATWLSWPHKEASWPGKIESIFPRYAEFVKYLSMSEEVCINVWDTAMRDAALAHLAHAGADLSRVHFYFHPTNDAWCRDHGPAFLVNRNPTKGKAIVDWDYNAWGNKYPPYELDDVIPSMVGKALNLPVFYPRIIMEGGSVEFNGAGTVLTSTCCLLNENRNPHLDKAGVERYLLDYYGMDRVLWVSEGIVGDDTDGHIDDTVRFVNADTVLSVVERNPQDENYAPLQRNLMELRGMGLNVIELPMPSPVWFSGQRLPASYANFYICNRYVIVPTYRCTADEEALRIIQDCYPTREVVGIDSTDLIWGLGSFHCLSQQEPG